jgi:hypothetical protein
MWRSSSYTFAAGSVPETIEQKTQVCAIVDA